MRRLGPALVGVFLVIGLGFAPASDERKQPAPWPVVLLFHPGGFGSGRPAMMDVAADVAANRGFRPVRVAYTLWNMPQANRDARAAARRWRQRGHAVYAYGDSAGGSLAVLLASDCGVNAAASNGGPYDFWTWWPGWDDGDPEFNWALVGTDARERTAFSPHHRDSVCQEVRAFASRADRRVPFSQSRRYAAKFRNVSRREIYGSHIYGYDDGYAYYRSVVRRALRWLTGK